MDRHDLVKFGPPPDALPEHVILLCQFVVSFLLLLALRPNFLLLDSGSVNARLCLIISAVCVAVSVWSKRQNISPFQMCMCILKYR